MPMSSQRSNLNKPAAGALMGRDLLFNTLGSYEIDPDGQVSRRENVRPSTLARPLLLAYYFSVMRSPLVPNCSLAPRDVECMRMTTPS